MALFSRKPATTKKAEKVKKKTAAPAVTASKEAPSKAQKDALRGVILRPRITEKGTLLAEGANVYVFEISKDATKAHVAKAVRTLYSVSPVKVAVVKSPAKKTFIRGHVGSRTGIKKAYVYLKKGEKIEFA